ncbi:MAG: 30S ribosomal protein S2 [Thermoprotei archaeon]
MSKQDNSSGERGKKTEKYKDEERTEQLKVAPTELYVTSGLHIGTRYKSKYMQRFIFRTRVDGINIISPKDIDERIRVAGKFLSFFEPAKILVVASRPYAIQPVKKFCELVGSISSLGRFLPGMLTNPQLPFYLEPDVVFVNDPMADSQAVEEASKVGIPVVALCDTEHECSNIDLVIPVNNKGKRALATVYWLLARQILRERGEIPPDGDLSVPIDDFEAKLTEES